MGRVILRKSINWDFGVTGGYISDYKDNIQLMNCNGLTVKQMHDLFSKKKLVVDRVQYKEEYELLNDGKEKCQYCDDDTCNKDIFFNWLPAMFGLEKEDHDYNPDVTVFITDDNELELCVMMSDDYLVKEKKKILFCPFCGRRLRND